MQSFCLERGSFPMRQWLNGLDPHHPMLWCRSLKKLARMHSADLMIVNMAGSACEGIWVSGPGGKKACGACGRTWALGDWSVEAWEGCRGLETYAWNRVLACDVFGCPALVEWQKKLSHRGWQRSRKLSVRNVLLCMFDRFTELQCKGRIVCQGRRKAPQFQPQG